MSTKTTFRKDQYVVCKYGLNPEKNNGDVIVGRIDSVRAAGKVMLHNLLSDMTSVKEARVLGKRNIVVPKREAMHVIEVFKKSGRAAARDYAVRVADKFSATPRRRRHTPQVDQDVKELVEKYKLLTDGKKQQFGRTVWSDVLTVFGVDL